MTLSSLLILWLVAFFVQPAEVNSQTCPLAQCNDLEERLDTFNVKATTEGEAATRVAAEATEAYTGTTGATDDTQQNRGKTTTTAGSTDTRATGNS